MKVNKLGLTALVIGIVVVLCLGVISAGALTVWAFTSNGETSAIDTSTIPLIETVPEIEEPLVETLPSAGADIDLGPLFAPFWESWEILHDEYVDQPLDDAALAQGALEGLTSALETEEIDPINVQVPSNAPSLQELAENASTPEELQSLFEPFWETWQVAEYAEVANYEDLMQEALRGMVAAVGDPYTSYLDPDEFHQLSIPLDGEYEGIGAWVDPTAEYLTIISPMEGSPAEKAGLKPGDQIIGVDGEDMTGIDGNLVIRRVLGPADSIVVLTIKREGVDAPFDVAITRARITIPSVESELLEDGVAYVQLTNFGEDTAQDLRDALKELLKENPRGLIVDLRNNGGGYLDTAVLVTSEFLEGGVVLYEEFGDGSREPHEVRSGGLGLDIPLVVLINEGTASASEILAGAIQDYERGALVGTTTFGKGSVQLPITLANDQGVLKVTIARWLTPDEHLIQDIGLDPDYVVLLSDEDIEAGRDPQLAKAIELLLEQ